MRRVLWVGMMIGLLLGATSAFASLLAFDNPSAWDYNDGWQTGDNGGYGFGKWSLGLTNPAQGGQNGHFMGDSTLNGDALDNGIVNGLPNDGDVNTMMGPVPDWSALSPAPPLLPNVSVPRAWGMYANSGQTADAIRPFTGSLAVGQTVICNLDNGWIQGGSTVGVGLQNAAGQNLWELFFTGGNPSYTVNDAGGAILTPVPFGDEGLNIAFTLVAPNAYQLTMTQFNGNTFGWGGLLMAPPIGAQTIDQFRFFNFNAGGGGSFDAYLGGRGGAEPGAPVAGLQIIPEPATLGLVGLAALSVLMRRRLQAREE